MERYKTIRHTFEPVWNQKSEILILGTFPSVKSRENQFYYGHPKNRFWKLLANIYKEPVPETIDAKKELVLKHHLAVWDVIGECDIVGSSDSSIRNVVPNDLTGLLEKSSIHTILANGAKAHSLYQKHQQPKTGMAAHKLPSTSPANAAWTLERLKEAWSAVLLQGSDP
ncbi:MAG: DNA-deoxyinosine glycosylase [Eubacterium sp.]|nr:DNA-deoxyinosine glycosylase [Eubacterium sp.]